MPLALNLVISGGQSGADRAGLDFAIAAGLKHGGWCPKGRLAEDGPIPAKYNLKETASDTYPERTKKNVAWADATVVFTKRAVGKGSALTLRTVAVADKLSIVLYSDASIADNSRRLADWLVETNPNILNVAGSRESSEPGIYQYTGHVLQAAYSFARVAAPKDPFSARTY